MLGIVALTRSETMMASGELRSERFGEAAEDGSRLNRAMEVD